MKNRLRLTPNSQLLLLSECKFTTNSSYIATCAVQFILFLHTDALNVTYSLQNAHLFSLLLQSLMVTPHCFRFAQGTPSRAHGLVNCRYPLLTPCKGVCKTCGFEKSWSFNSWLLWHYRSKLAVCLLIFANLCIAHFEENVQKCGFLIQKCRFWGLFFHFCGCFCVQKTTVKKSNSRRYFRNSRRYFCSVRCCFCKVLK